MVSSQCASMDTIENIYIPVNISVYAFIFPGFLNGRNDYFWHFTHGRIGQYHSIIAVFSSRLVAYGVMIFYVCSSVFTEAGNCSVGWYVQDCCGICKLGTLLLSSGLLLSNILASVFPCSLHQNQIHVIFQNLFFLVQSALLHDAITCMQHSLFFILY